MSQYNGQYNGKKSHMQEEIPTAVLGLNDREALINIVTFYQRYLRAMPSASAKRKRQLAEVQGVLAKVLMHGTSTAAMLTYAEVACIDSAISAFVAQVKAKIPKSQDRDGVIESCQQLRTYMVTTFAPINTC